MIKKYTKLIDVKEKFKTNMVNPTTILILMLAEK